MHRKLTILAATVAATFGTLAVGLAGTASADAYYQVYGTGGYGLNVHTYASVSAPVIATLPEGATVDVICQEYAEPVTDPALGVTSSVWDELWNADTNQLVAVSDLYVNTPGVGVISVAPCDS
jgi:hypothetical protein